MKSTSGVGQLKWLGDLTLVGKKTECPASNLCLPYPPVGMLLSVKL